MISHVIDLTKSGQFHIITYPKVDLSLIICHLTYLTFLVNLLNQHFESFYAINLLIKLATPWALNTLFLQTNIIYSSKHEVYYPQIPLDGSVDKSFAERSLDFSLV